MSCSGASASPTSSTGGGVTKTQTIYALVFRYASGPALRLNLIPDCNPSLFTSSLAADATADIVSLVKRLLGS
jgi:hypothetical protein